MINNTGYPEMDNLTNCPGYSYLYPGVGAYWWNKIPPCPFCGGVNNYHHQFLQLIFSFGVSTGSSPEKSDPALR